MSYTKRIVCLANSWRQGGTCVAGKEILADGTYGAWIRPVSSRPTMEINDAELTKLSGYKLRLGDMVDISFERAAPHRHQVENHVITDGAKWIDRYWKSANELTDAIDHVTADLWHNGTNSKHGINDEVPDAVIDGITSSLLLIQVTRLEVHIAHEPKPDGHISRKFRGEFTHNGTPYIFRITDPSLNWRIKDRDILVHHYANPLLCISLSDVFEDTGYAHKLIAAVFADDM